MKAVVIGGTGSLGKGIIKNLLSQKRCNEVVCFSRDELKQAVFKEKLGKVQNVKFVLGDIRDADALADCVNNSYVVFNCAAYKRIPEMEAFPEESIKTNLLAVISSFKTCERAGVEHYIFSSTDKAIEPINAYGLSKALAEKYLISRINPETQTKIHIYRWGNVLGSRGSVIPYFLDCIKNNKIINLTDAEMTRFWIRLPDAIEFITDWHYWKTSGIKIPSGLKACSLICLLNACYVACGKAFSAAPTRCIGLRPGEKIHEKITHKWTSSDGPFFDTQELVDLVSEYMETP